MNEESDSLPPRSPDLPRVRPMTGAYDVLPWKGGRCLQCPAHDAEHGWCPVQAIRKAGRSPMCRYGYALAEKANKEKKTGETK